MSMPLAMCRGRSTFPEVSSNSKSGSTFGFPANNNGARLDMHYYVDTHMLYPLDSYAPTLDSRMFPWSVKLAAQFPEQMQRLSTCATFSLTRLWTSWPRSFRAQPRSKGTCRTTLILPRRFRSTKFSFLARTASGERTLSRRVAGIWPIWCLRPVRVCSSTIT